jgi:hypothetical protein
VVTRILETDTQTACLALADMSRPHLKLLLYGSFVEALGQTTLGTIVE